jgi:hypothetical protein
VRKLVLLTVLFYCNYILRGQNNFYFFNEYSLDRLKSGFNSYLILSNGHEGNETFVIIEGYNYYNIRVKDKSHQPELSGFIDSLISQNRQNAFLYFDTNDLPKLKPNVVKQDLLNREYWSYNESSILKKFFKDSILQNESDINMKSTLLFYFLAKGYYVGIDIHSSETFISLFNPEIYLKEKYSHDIEIVYFENGDLKKINIYENDKVVSIINDFYVLEQLKKKVFFNDKVKLRKYIIDKKYNK